MCVFTGRADGEDDAEGGQEHCPPSGVEEDAGVAQSHGGAPASACGKGPGSPGPGNSRDGIFHWEPRELLDEALSGTLKGKAQPPSRRGHFQICRRRQCAGSLVWKVPVQGIRS